MDDPRLQLEGLTLDLPSAANTNAGDPRFQRTVNGGRTVFRVLDDITFTAKSGDRIALIGRNGAGKTTLLRAIGGIFTPSAGRVVREGRMRILLNPGLGLEPELTGRANIRVLGLINGLSDREIEAARADILDFAQLGEFIDIPVKNYSAGMRMRLIYAVVTSGVSDILILDEVIGVGDKAFVSKANERRAQFMRGAGILLVASHAEGIIKQFCNRVLWLDKGRIIEDSDDVPGTLAAYSEAS
ncbi:MAG: ABC transporter ATP-binding protein [Pseudomonadota bacterium]